MLTLIYLGAFFALWAAGVAVFEWLDRRADCLPPPDRSVKRNAEVTDEMDRLRSRRGRES